MIRTLLTVIVLTVLPTPVFAEWTWVSQNVDGTTFYVDFERIRKHDGYVYYWELTDLLKPSKYGHLSSKVYIQGDCELFRFKYLSFVHHKQPMGQGSAISEYNYTPKNPEWIYPTPTSADEINLKRVCAYVK